MVTSVNIRGIKKHYLYLNWGSQQKLCSYVLHTVLYGGLMQKWFLRLLSAYDECLQVKNLCQPIPDMRHTDDAHLVALRPIWHAHISTCLVSAPRQWLTVYLHWYYSNRIVTYTGQTLHAVFVTVTLLYIISISSFKLHVRDKLIQFYRILYGARVNLTFFSWNSFLCSNKTESFNKL